MRQILIPTRLGEVLARDTKLQGAVQTSLARFEKWIENSGVPFFRDYTDHGPVHISEVLETSEQMISERSWTVISPGDAAVLILATLLHDSAMHLQEDGFQALAQTGKQRPRIEGFDRVGWQDLWDQFVSEASRLHQKQLVALFGSPDPIQPPDPATPRKWTAQQYQLIGEFIRRHHPRLAHEVAYFGVPGPNRRKLKLADDEPQILRLSGLVARSHGMSIRSCLDFLDWKFHKRDYNGIHAVFLMAVLRVADYLQIQSSRAPRELLEVKRLRSPISRREWKVHHAIRNITYNEPDPEAVKIQVHSDKTDLETFLRLQDWLEGVQFELDTSWATLGEVYGRYPPGPTQQVGAFDSQGALGSRRPRAVRFRG